MRFDSEAAARVIDLGGAYITAEDIGTTTRDMDYMAGFTLRDGAVGDARRRW